MVIAVKDSPAYYLKRGIAVLIGILILDAINMMFFARDFLLPVVIGFIIAFTFRPAVRYLSVRGVPAWATASGIAAGILIGGFLAG
jgi:predicted PurR-regulated permease PerM